jgi:large subunit ribosomal protein L18
MANKRRNIARERRKQRVRKKVVGTDERPRICVFKSNKHIYAQVISDDRNATLASVSTLAKGLASQVGNRKGVGAAKLIGLALAKICKEKNITHVVFDRNGFLFHGRIKAIADDAREGGLEF